MESEAHDHDLDMKVRQVLTELEALGLPATAETVQSRVGKRMSDVLQSLRRLSGKHGQDLLYLSGELPRLALKH
jgi:hypothetical protein